MRMHPHIWQYFLCFGRIAVSCLMKVPGLLIIINYCGVYVVHSTRELSMRDIDVICMKKVRISSAYRKAFVHYPIVRVPCGSIVRRGYCTQVTGVGLTH